MDFHSLVNQPIKKQWYTDSEIMLGIQMNIVHNMNSVLFAHLHKQFMQMQQQTKYDWLKPIRFYLFDY